MRFVVSSVRCRPVVAGLVLLVFVAVGCGGDGEVTSEASPSTSQPTTTAPAPESWDVDEVPPPEAITVEYLQRVMDELDQGWGDAFRRYKADEGPTPENEPMLAELYVEPALGRIRSSWGQLAGLRFDGVKEDPGNPDTVVREVVRSTPTCVLISVRRTLDATRTGPPASEELAAAYVALRPRPAGEPVSELNPTAWRMLLDGRMADGSVPDTCQ